MNQYKKLYKHLKKEHGIKATEEQMNMIIKLSVFTLYKKGVDEIKIITESTVFADSCKAFLVKVFGEKL